MVRLFEVVETVGALGGVALLGYHSGCVMERRAPVEAASAAVSPFAGKIVFAGSCPAGR
jgi:hypothetical protein